MVQLDKNERRQANRIYKHDQIQVTCEGVRNEDGPSIAQVMDLSDGGVHFVAAVAFTKGDRLTISNQERELHAQVLDCQKCINGYTVRAEFDKD
ncbi:MAG: PilZ domain-containing protein [Planctomycetes bacterium]|nr:PilZ domain-containing protein [Planctomycetota bacterium]